MTVRAVKTVAYIGTKTECLVIKVGMMYACGCLTHIEVLKEELPWATDKQLQVVCNIMLFKQLAIPLRK